MWLVCHSVNNDIRTPHFCCSREEALQWTNDSINSLVSFADSCGFKHELNVSNESSRFTLLANGVEYAWRIFKCDVKVV